MDTPSVHWAERTGAYGRSQELAFAAPAPLSEASHRSTQDPPTFFARKCTGAAGRPQSAVPGSGP